MKLRIRNGGIHVSHPNRYFYWNAKAIRDLASFNSSTQKMTINELDHGEPTNSKVTIKFHNQSDYDKVKNM